ncbi:MAG: hypothetical protein P9L94_14010 [Candidatus Hinthialibacter antarcticus]|nr:hypothetical protein [Candidatus Hinthialibacter antarcticus]
MNRSVLIQSISFCSVLIFALMFVGCSKQAEEPAPEPRTLSVTLLQVNGSPSIEAFEAKMAEYASGDELLTINTRAKAVSATSTNAELIAAIEGADLVIFPSLLNRQLREQSNAFHPVEANSSLPDHLASAYTGADSSSAWAAALAIDPIVFVQKVGVSRTAGFSGPMTEWGQLRVLTNLERSRGNQEPFWVFMQNDSALQDAWASYFLAFRYASLPAGLYEQWVNTVQRAIMDDANSIVPNADENSVSSFPFVKNITDFMQSTAYFTSLRYSELSGVGEKEQAGFTWSLFPSESGTSTACYAIAAAVPLLAANPDDAQAWVNKAVTDNETWSSVLNGITVNTDGLKNSLNLPDNFRFFLREGSSKIPPDELIKMFENKPENLNDVVEKIFRDFYPVQNGV